MAATVKPKYFRKIGTNEVFGYSPFMAKRNDMVPYDGPIPIPETEATENTEKDSDANTPQLIVEAISKLDKEDFTKNGKPKIPSLEKILLTAITPEQRNEAWQKFQEAEIAKVKDGNTGG